MEAHRRLDRAYFERPTDVVAVELIGHTLATRKGGAWTTGRIVETEAYGGADDLASHAAIYRRSREAIMSGTAGLVYVYRIYGVHACFNVVAHRPGETGAVLIRALEPVNGIEMMSARRGTDNFSALCAGPGRLTQALDIALEDTGVDVVVDDTIAVLAGVGVVALESTTRIGISRDVDRLWRFVDPESRCLSRPLRSGASAAGASITP